MEKESKNFEVVKIKNEDREFHLYIKDIDGSNFNFLTKNNYQNIKYENIADLKNKEIGLFGHYHDIKFNSSNYPDIKYLGDSMIEMLNNKKNNERYEDVVKNIIRFFERITKESKTEKIIGDLGEALFILRCINNYLISEINDSLFIKNDEDNFDFYFNNSTCFEIKSTTNFKSEIKLKNRQKRNDNNCHVVVVKFDIEKTKINNNFINIIDLYKMIESKMSLNRILIDKKTQYENELDFIQKFNIDLNKVKMAFFKQDCYPEVKILKEGALKEMIFILDVTESLDDYNKFDSKLSRIISS